MNEVLVEDLIKSPGDKSVRSRLFDDETDTFFWVDHREYDETIVEYCEKCLRTGKLSAEFEESTMTLDVVYGGEKTRVPLKQSPEDRHITILTMSRALSPDYEIRFVRASNGGDTLAFLPMTSERWRELEAVHGGKSVDAAFMKLAEKPNTFTDPIPLQDDKPWWKLW